MSIGEKSFLGGILLVFAGACCACWNNYLVIVLSLLGMLSILLAAFRGSEG